MLTGINLQVTVGECLLLTGKSGSGKSTFLRVITGLEAKEKCEIIFKIL